MGGEEWGWFPPDITLNEKSYGLYVQVGQWEEGELNFFLVPMKGGTPKYNVPPKKLNEYDPMEVFVDTEEREGYVPVPKFVTKYPRVTLLEGQKKWLQKWGYNLKKIKILCRNNPEYWRYEYRISKEGER